MRNGRLSWLDGTSGADRERWLLVWRAIPELRPYYHPAFVAGTAPANRQPAAVHFEAQDGAHILYPFWLGCVADLPFCPDSLKDAHDIVSPYGYGGPSYSGPVEERPRVEEEFRQLFADVCRERRIISEFVRQDIRDDHLVRYGDKADYQQDNVVVQLGLTEEARLARYQHKVRKNIRRARDLGLRAIVEDQGTYLDQFLDVYHGTMQRRHASPYFFFRRDLFETLITELSLTRSLAFVHVLDGDRVISTELLLCSRDRIYSFLGGTREDSLPKRPNDLLKHSAILWGTQQGLTEYVLGGGAQPGDSIFQYKRTFEPQGIVPYYTRRVIHSQTAYEELTAARQAELGRIADPMFFPRYRA